MCKIQFITPLDGDMLSNAAGNPTGQSLSIEVQVQAPAHRRITLNGAPMTYENGIYTARALLDGYRNTLEALDTDSGEYACAGVYWLRDADRKYRLSVDDNIWFLQDIAKNADSYRSLFDNPYLALYKDVHDRYGTKVHLNIYYECPEFGGFNLTQMPDKYKSEWRENADWLQLSFHADQNLPDRPYEFASYAQVKHDYERVVSEIRRFAGDEVLVPVTTIHWGEANRYGCRAVRAQGVRVLMSYLDFDGNGRPLVSYYLSPERIRTANTYGFIRDHDEDLIFGKIDVVLNMYSPAKIRTLLSEAKARYPKKGFWELLIHEEYFYPHYRQYLPDFKQRVLAGVEWCVEQGCTPAFVEDVVLEK